MVVAEAVEVTETVMTVVRVTVLTIGGGVTVLVALVVTVL